MNQRSFTDQMGQELVIDWPPQRIISLVPSQTELLFDLGLDREIIGITKYCTRPLGWISSKQIVGGTKNLDIDAISQLRPDLIIGNKEENEQESIMQLKRDFPVWMSDIVSFNDALSMIRSVGMLTSLSDQSDRIVHSINNAFFGIRKFPSLSVLYLIWRKPWMVAGKSTFIDTLLNRIGLTNAVTSERYSQLSTTEIQVLKPDYIFLSSEPFPFREKHIAELVQIAPSSKVVLVDGEMFSWYGSRLMYAPEYFNRINPG